MNITSTVSILSITCGTALAGFNAPNAHSWPMEHIMVSLDNGQIHAHANADASSPIELVQFAGQSYSGNAAALDDTYYSDQYGWVADGFIGLNSGEFMWVEMTNSSAGLNVYEGGMRMMRDMHTYNPILGTDSSDDAWMWSGMMVHNWYSADSLGDYQVTYEVYIGDATGNAITSYTSDSVTLYFNAVPSPAGLSLLGLTGLAATRRRRA